MTRRDYSSIDSASALVNSAATDLQRQMYNRYKDLLRKSEPVTPSGDSDLILLQFRGGIPDRNIIIPVESYSENKGPHINLIHIDDKGLESAIIGTLFVSETDKNIRGTGCLFGVGTFRNAIDYMEDLLLSDTNFQGIPLQYRSPAAHITAAMIDKLSAGYDILSGLIGSFETSESPEALELRLNGIKSYWETHFEKIVSSICFN